MWLFKISHISFNKIQLQKRDIFTKFGFQWFAFFKGHDFYDDNCNKEAKMNYILF